MESDRAVHEFFIFRAEAERQASSREGIGMETAPRNVIGFDVMTPRGALDLCALVGPFWPAEVDERTGPVVS